MCRVERPYITLEIKALNESVGPKYRIYINRPNRFEGNLIAVKLHLDNGYQGLG